MSKADNALSGAILILEDEFLLAEDCAQQISAFGLEVIGPIY